MCKWRSKSISINKRSFIHQYIGLRHLPHVPCFMFLYKWKVNFISTNSFINFSWNVFFIFLHNECCQHLYRGSCCCFNASNIKVTFSRRSKSPNTNIEIMATHHNQVPFDIIQIKKKIIKKIRKTQK